MYQQNFIHYDLEKQYLVVTHLGTFAKFLIKNTLGGDIVKFHIYSKGFLMHILTT